jgi:hypothetical protein
MPHTATSGAAPDAQRAIAAVQRHAFAALLAGQTPRVADITETASRDALGAARAVAWLEHHGQLERDGELLVGAHGLTRRTTPHTLTIDEQTLHTWSAYDAIAIPLALGATARATTTCPACQRSLTIDIDAGHLPTPTRRCYGCPSGLASASSTTSAPTPTCSAPRSTWRTGAAPQASPTGRSSRSPRFPRSPAPHGPTSPPTGNP